MLQRQHLPFFFIYTTRGGALFCPGGEGHSAKLRCGEATCVELRNLYSVSYLVHNAVKTAGASMGFDLADHLHAFSRKWNHRWSRALTPAALSGLYTPYQILQIHSPACISTAQHEHVRGFAKRANQITRHTHERWKWHRMRRTVLGRDY